MTGKKGVKMKVRRAGSEAHTEPLMREHRLALAALIRSGGKDAGPLVRWWNAHWPGPERIERIVREKDGSYTVVGTDESTCTFPDMDALAAATFAAIHPDILAAHGRGRGRPRGLRPRLPGGRGIQMEPRGIPEIAHSGAPA